MPETHYPSPGRCIYCGRSDVALTDEHIIPLALQGFLVLDKASCTECAKVINSFEGPIIGSLEHFRTRYDVRTRRPKDRKTAFTLKRADSSPITIPAKEMPATAFLYKFGRANILRGLPPLDPTFEWLPVPYCDGEALNDAIKRHGWDGQLQIKMRPNDFARLLAKIAYSYAVTELGMDAFEPLCLDVIMGRASNCAYLVGGSMDLQPLPDSTGDHHIGVGLIDQPDRPKLVIVPVRLFQQMGSPHHHVIVGRLASDQQEARVRGCLAQGSPVQYPGV